MKHRSRIAPLALATLAGALAAGGGYALASNPAPTIHGCVTRSHQLLVQKRCAKGQTKLVWNQQGAQGLQGVQGPQGARGVSGASDWTLIGTSPVSAIVVSGNGIAVARDSVGVYTVTAGGSCAAQNGAISVTPESGAITPGHVPEAVVVRDSNAQATLFSTFDVHIYDNDGGVLTPEDGITFDVIVSCQP